MKKTKMLLCLLSAGMLCFPLSASAEKSTRAELAETPVDQIISGTVEDANGPLIGATVKVAGTNSGTVTDFEGHFKLKCKVGDILEISYVGYAT